jgi:hypothetical protein
MGPGKCLLLSFDPLYRSPTGLQTVMQAQNDTQCVGLAVLLLFFFLISFSHAERVNKPKCRQC